MMATLETRIAKIEKQRRQARQARQVGHRNKLDGFVVAYANDPDSDEEPTGLWRVGADWITPEDAQARARGKQLIVVEYADDPDGD